MTFDYPQELPISAFRDALVGSFAKNRVTIVCGDTGSGKTTQLPKMLMEAGCGEGGRLIACTQPRLPSAGVAGVSGVPGVLGEDGLSGVLGLSGCVSVLGSC